MVRLRPQSKRCQRVSRLPPNCLNLGRPQPRCSKVNSEQAGQEDDANHQAQNDLLYISTATKRLYALFFVVQVLIGMAYVVGQETVFRDAEDRKSVSERVFPYGRIQNPSS